MSRTIIIGYGNPLRGDDAVGHHAARRAGELLDNASFEIHTCHQLTPEYAETISGFDRAVFLDASAEGTPGDLTVRRLNNAGIPHRTVTHHIDPESLLACAKALYGKTPEAYIITVTAESFGYMEQLSQTVRDRIDDMISAVVRIANPDFIVKH